MSDNSTFVFTLPDLGEGTVEAEILEWYVAVGDEVSEGSPMADVMTDKANVEVPAPVSGKVLSLGGAAGDVVAVGAPLITFALAGAAPEMEQAQQQPPAPKQASPEPKAAQPAAPKAVPKAVPTEASPTEPTAESKAQSKAKSAVPTKVITSPAIRKHAAEAGIDLSQIQGSGPRGRILRRDLAQADTTAASVSAQRPANGTSGPVEQINIRGLRRMIAQRLSASKREIPHFTYVEEVDVTALDALRRRLNSVHAEPADLPLLTYLPLVSLALIQALQSHPLCNARYQGESELLERYEAVHLGIATQTEAGLKVPVVHDAQQHSLWQLAEQIRGVTGAARDGSAGRETLSGSTITITSLGKLGGIVSTPVINAPEVAIIGLNKAVPRPVVQDGEVVVRTMMNISGSFDHRIIDGHDAASFIDTLKTLLEEPGLIFVAKP